MKKEKKLHISGTFFLKVLGKKKNSENLNFLLVWKINFVTIFELGRICFDIDLLLEGDFLIIFILNLSYMDMTSDHIPILMFIVMQ